MHQQAQQQPNREPAGLDGALSIKSVATPVTTSANQGGPMQRDLVEQAMAGDHEAFSELTRLSTAKLYAIARLILRDNTRAEDAVQEALVAAWRQLKALRDPDRFDAWLRRRPVWSLYRRYHLPPRLMTFAIALPRLSFFRQRPERSAHRLRLAVDHAE